VDRGSIELVRQSASGGEAVVLEADPGWSFGEIGPTYGLPRTATARSGARGAVVRAHTVTEFRQRLIAPQAAS
jgi:putative ABC transport system ATP-binding protein